MVALCRQYCTHGDILQSLCQPSASSVVCVCVLMQAVSMVWRVRGCQCSGGLMSRATSMFSSLSNSLTLVSWRRVN